MKKCLKCNEIKSLDEYSICKTNKSGRHTYCKSCAAANSKKWYLNNKNNPNVAERLRKNWREKSAAIHFCVEKIKTRYGCCCCNEKDGCCLDFHHLFNKKDNVSEILRYKNLDRIITEINKCIVICANCHRKYHAGRLKIQDVKSLNIIYSDLVTEMQNGGFEFTTGKRLKKNESCVMVVS